MKHNPTDPHWPDLDRFIMSLGHASAMQYALHLEELKRLRQWGSKTPGHPEYGLTPGVEMTTTTLGWERYVGIEGVAIGLSGFGASAPINVLYEQFGLTAQHVVDEATMLVEEQQT